MSLSPDRPRRSSFSALDGLHRITRAANSTRSLATALQTVAETVADVMDADACSLFLFEPDENRLYLRATKGLNPNAVDGMSLTIGQGITGQAAQAGHPIVVDDVQRDSRFHVDPRLNEAHYGSMVAVPIILFAHQDGSPRNDELLGVVTVQHVTTRAFTEEEVHFLEVVAGELAFFIVNTRRYEQTDERLRQKVRELMRLQQVTEALLQELDHRVGGSLATIKSLLAMQRRRLAPGSEAEVTLAQAIDQIQAIAEVQQLLRETPTGVTTIQAIAQQIIDRKRGPVDRRLVHFTVSGEDLSISPPDANVVAVMLNELIDNALHHGLAAEGGTIEITIWREGDQLLLEVRDDGPRHPAGPDRPSSRRGHSIIAGLATGRGGSFHFEQDHDWSRARLRFPYQPPAR